MKNLTKQFSTCILTAVLCVLILSLTGCKKKTEPPKPNTESTVNNMIDSAKRTADKVVADAAEQTICPVMSGKINKDLFTEYKGKKVYFCCEGCKEKFEESPEKYLSKLPQFKTGE